MKRRNLEFCGKLRRPTKRSKITESLYGSITYLYVKFFLLWAAMLLCDFLLEFRFEFLWPFYLLVKSVYDSFKYQGLAFSVIFVFVAFTSDMICYLLVPVHWLFFAASTYVWMQYVWQMERGLCWPSVSLWLFFVYVEASIRFRDLKNLPFHLELSRTFAAHCIGYPVVTLGFGVKSYLSYKMRLRTKRNVSKDNNFCMQLMRRLLLDDQDPSCIKNSYSPNVPPGLIVDSEPTSVITANNHHQIAQPSKTIKIVNSNGQSTQQRPVESLERKLVANGLDKNDMHYMEHQLIKKIPCVNENDSEVNSNNKTSFKCISQSKSEKQNGVSLNVSVNSAVNSSFSSVASKNTETGISTIVTSNGGLANNNSTKWPNSNSFSPEKTKNSNSLTNHHQSPSSSSNTSGTSPLLASLPTTSSVNNLLEQPQQLNNNHTQLQLPKRTKNSISLTNNIGSPAKDEHIVRLESDIKRLKADLQQARQNELEIKEKYDKINLKESDLRHQYTRLHQDNESLQTKLHNLVTARQHDKQTIGLLEKKLQEEKKNKAQLEQQLVTERKQRKAALVSSEESTPYHQLCNSSPSSKSNSDQCDTLDCKGRRRELKADFLQLQKEYQYKEDQLRLVDQEAQSLRQYKESCYGDTEVLMSALSAMQDKNSHLEHSLSAETKVKLDLFSALGDARRQLEIYQSTIQQREKEIDDLKCKLAELMAVLPGSGLGNALQLLYSPRLMSEEDGAGSATSSGPLELSSKSLSGNEAPDLSDWAELSNQALLDAETFSSKGVPSDL